MKQILVIDIGNSYCKIGVFQQDQLITLHAVKTNKINLSTKALMNLFSKKFNAYKITGAIVGSVVKSYIKTFNQVIQKVFHVQSYLLTENTKLNFKFDKAIKRNDVGQDLIALTTYCANQSKNAIGFSFGTASVGICLINNELKGAIIAAGLSRNVKSLIKEADLIKNDSFNIFNKSLIGMNTKTAIESGIYHLRNGFINSFYTYTKRLIKKNNTKLVCVISGHEAFEIQADFKYELNPKAILFGYYQIYLMNCN